MTGNTEIQPIDFIVIDNKIIVEAIYRDTVIHGGHGSFRFELDTSGISPSKLEGKKVYMNYIPVTDGLIDAKFDRNGINDFSRNEIIVNIGTDAFDESTYKVCRFTVGAAGITVQNQTNSYNVYAEYNEGTRTLYLTDKAAEA